MKKVTHGTKNNKSNRDADREYTVSEPCGLLEFLLVTLRGFSRNNVKSLLTHKEVMVDGSVVTQYDHPLQPGQTVRIVRSFHRDSGQKNMPEVLFEDDEIIAIHKPAGLLSIASDTEKVQTAYHLMTEYVKMNHPEGRIYSVHRLDRETSGVLLFAKNERIKTALQDNWSELVTERGYIAVVEGKLKEKSGTIVSWLKQTETLLVYSSNREGDGQKAVTEYRVLKENEDYSLLEIHLQTGRKNQIRVHMKDLGHSVVGDKKYGSVSDPLKRLGLHANLLKLKHPFSGKLLKFEVQTPKSFDNLFRAGYSLQNNRRNEAKK